MPENTETTAAEATEILETDEVIDMQQLRDAQLGGAAAFADAEMREILNLLGGDAEGGSCCGGGCCSV